MSPKLRLGLFGAAALLLLATLGSLVDDSDSSADAYGPMGYGEMGYGPNGPMQGMPDGYGPQMGYPPQMGGDPQMHMGGYGQMGGGGYGGGYAGGGYGGGYAGGGAQTMSDIGDMQMQNWQAQQATNDEMHRQTINGIRGTADVYDGQTGTTYYGVEGGSGAYWANPTSGAVVGTDTYADNPDVSSYNATTNLDDM